LTNGSIHESFGTPKHKEAAGESIEAVAGGLTGFFTGKIPGKTAVKPA
jgi:hypothetical protein